MTEFTRAETRLLDHSRSHDPAKTLRMSRLLLIPIILVVIASALAVIEGFGIFGGERNLNKVALNLAMIGIFTGIYLSFRDRARVLTLIKKLTDSEQSHERDH